jgi:flagellar protein FlaF
MLQQASDAYRHAHRTTATARELEAAMLLAAAAYLQAAIAPTAQTTVSQAVSFNCKIWTILVTSSMRTENALPQHMRQSLAELGLFVLERTARLIAEGGLLAPSDASVFIEINRRIAAGLRPVVAA